MFKKMGYTFWIVNVKWRDFKFTWIQDRFIHRNLKGIVFCEKIFGELLL